MAVVASSSPWIPEDDLLLKNAVEKGASLEALAKGVVQFSRRFSFQELQDRWHSLLYDSNTSVQASACMFELEGSAPNLSSKFNGSDKAKQNQMGHEKRKVGNIRKRYYAMQKRIRRECLSSADIGFVDEPNLHNRDGNRAEFQEHVTLANGPPVGNFMPSHFGIQETDFDILQQAFPETMIGIAATNEVANIGDAFRSECPNSLVDNHVDRVARNDCLHVFPADVFSLPLQDLLRNGVTESFQLSSVQKGIAHTLEDNYADLGKCSGYNEVGSSQPLLGTKLFETDVLETKPLSTIDITNNKLQDVCFEFGGRQHFNYSNSDGNPSFHTTGLSPPMPSMPIWKTMEDISAPSMPVSVSPRDKILGAEDIPVLPDNDDCKRKSSSGHGFIHSGRVLTDRQNGEGFINSTALSDGEFPDLTGSLLDFSNEIESLLMDVDGEDTMDESCYENSLLCPKDVNECDAHKVEPKTRMVSNAGFPTACGACPAESEVICFHLRSVHVDGQGVSHSKLNMASTSMKNSKPLEFNHGNIHCILNTEDPEIPCNDDIFLLIHPTASYASFVTRPITTNAIDTASSANEKDTGQVLNFTKEGDSAQSFLPSQMVGPCMLPATSPDHALVGCTVESELPDASCMALPPRYGDKAIGDPTQCRSEHKTPNSALSGKLNNVTKFEFGVVDTPGTYGEMPLPGELGYVEIALPESVVNPSTSDQEDSESDNDVPYFSDIEAMILEMDLASYDQDSYFGSRVSKYQQEDFKRQIMRLEQCAQSSLQRAMASQGALAILHSHHQKHFIRKTEIILGRSTEEIGVDIDLAKEGCGNKISRRQAIIKMEGDGSFFLKNLGRTSISVNGKAVATGQSVGLSSSCLIEVRGMSFMFEKNYKSVRRYLDNMAKKSKGTNFEWSPAGEP